MAKRKGDPLAKQGGETTQQWKMRLALAGVVSAEKGTNKPTIYTEQHGEYREQFVTEVESATRAKTSVRKSRSALEYMRQRGSLTDEQYYSAQRIAQVAEMLQSSVSGSCASMEARVDCSGSARDALNESLYRVRAEAAYTEWRSKLPLPRRMVIDMVTQDAGLAEIAAEHNMGWPKARKMLVAALDAWPEVFGRYVKGIDQEDLDAQHARLRA